MIGLEFALVLACILIGSRVGGIGLGLTFVQRVVLEHHGRLAVSDATERGTVFRVELPTAESEA